MRYFGRNVFLVVMILAFIPVAAGCSLSLGSPQKKPEVTKDDVKTMVEKEMSTPETRRIIEEAVAGHELKDLLKAPEADKLMESKMMENIESPKVSKAIQEQLTNAMRSPESQKVLQEHIKRAMATPDIQQTMQTMVQQAMMKMMQGGRQGGAGAGGGQQEGGMGQ